MSRKELSGAARDAGESLKLGPSERLVLGELVGCFGEQVVAGGLMVWPQNTYLMRRTGLSERSLRLVLRKLIDRGLIAAVDSANRKRFAIKAGDGTVLHAYGFALTPLYTRRYDLAADVSAQRRETEAQSQRFDRITIARKRIEGVLGAMADHFPTTDTRPILESFAALLAEVPRRGSAAAIGGLVSGLESLCEEAENLFLSVTSVQEIAGSPGAGCRLIESTTEPSIDYCRETGGERAIEPALVAQACPVVATDYGCTLRTVGDMEAAGRALRGSLGAGQEAWAEAVDKVGLTLAAVLVLYVLQLHENDVAGGRHSIKNPGGLYRSLARKMAAGEFDLRNGLRRLKRGRAN